MINKAQRHIDYKRALKELNLLYGYYKHWETVPYMSICKHLPGSLAQIISNYPELVNQMPRYNHAGIDLKKEIDSKQYSFYWWNPRFIQVRRKVLTKCIKETS